jgi:hypothetical protein
MKIRTFRARTLLVLGALLTVAGGANGAGIRNWQPFISASPVYQGGGDIDNGGRFNARGVIVRAFESRDPIYALIV